MSTKCTETCSGSADTCGGTEGSISTFGYTSVDASSLSVSAQNFRGEDATIVPLKTGEVNLENNKI